MVKPDRVPNQEILFHDMYRKPVISLDQLVVTHNMPKTGSDILDEWTWLIGKEKRPVLITARGDAFIQDLRDGTMHFLNVGAADVSPVAETAEAFDTLLADPAFVTAYLRTEQVDMLRRQGKVLSKNQVYSLRIPLSLGGDTTVDNIEATDVMLHFSIAGQIERQIADIPEGAPISGIKINGMRSTQPWWKFW